MWPPNTHPIFVRHRWKPCRGRLSLNRSTFCSTDLITVVHTRRYEKLVENWDWFTRFVEPRNWTTNRLRLYRHIWITCFILHNMIVSDQQSTQLEAEAGAEAAVAAAAATALPCVTPTLAPIELDKDATNDNLMVLYANMLVGYNVFQFLWLCSSLVCVCALLWLWQSTLFIWTCKFTFTFVDVGRVPCSHPIPEISTPRTFGACNACSYNKSWLSQDGSVHVDSSSIDRKYFSLEIQRPQFIATGTLGARDTKSLRRLPSLQKVFLKRRDAHAIQFRSPRLTSSDWSTSNPCSERNTDCLWYEAGEAVVFLIVIMVTASSAPRYAPHDPTLPPPWRALIDGTSQLTYYWNPDTNVTQYEKPGAVSTPVMPAQNGGYENSASGYGAPKLASIPPTTQVMIRSRSVRFSLWSCVYRF